MVFAIDRIICFLRRTHTSGTPLRAFKVQLDELEARLRELASLLSEMADALTSDLESIRIIDGPAGDAGAAGPTMIVRTAQEWPSIREIERLLFNWLRLRELSDSGLSR
jgi:hypothetical protein